MKRDEKRGGGRGMAERVGEGSRAGNKEAARERGALCEQSR